MTDNISPDDQTISRLDAQKQLLLMHDSRIEIIDKAIADIIAKQKKEQQSPLPIIILSVAILIAFVLLYMLPKEIDSLKKVAEKAISLISQG